jgi:hypothetical protein
MKAKSRGVVVGALIAGGAVMAMRGCLSKPAPDAQLADRFDDLCKIARANVDTPVKGVRKLGAYLVKHTDDMFSEWGATIIAIETIKDDDKHDERAYDARDRLAAPLQACQRDWMRFAEAVENNPEASELVANAGERLNRTLEIILSNKTRFDFKHLPEQLEAALK